MNAPSPRPIGRLAAVVFAAALAATAHAQRFVDTRDPAHPRLRYPDSLTSVNDRCAVSQARLNPKARPVYVNGEPIGFC